MKQIIGIAILTTLGWSCDLSTIENVAVPGDIPPDLKISLERTACKGSCPVYKLTVFADGLTNFDGKQDTKTIGIMRTKTDKKEIVDLIEAFNEADYFSLPDIFDRDSGGCGNWATDLPSVITSVRKDKKEKEIDHYYGCRGDGKAAEEPLKRLSALESKIDQIAGTKRWVGE